VVIKDVKHRSQRHKRIDEGQSDPDDEREVLLPQRLAGLLPVTAPAEERTRTKINDTGDERNKSDGRQR
jgi:hypothetical protein